ncbi:MAG: hypothetical protein CO189_07685 [candidate division Zixibacteria bacterium CG_4_9_14_3_um_filter_46_8]|nr:MAG: hypothetical protein CO189_07685 [candidate division Zixibacteria bacterium CG_4_9_14_3_um_filter_46_8]
MKKFRIRQQIISLSILFALLIASFIVARLILIPRSFGEYGHYRADAIDDITAQPINYAGSVACIECHDDIVELKANSNHKGLSCEICHGPAAKHIEAPDENLPSAPRERGFCPLCHGYDPSRPTGFPQIVTALHNPGTRCMSCHNPHNPILPHTPEDCSACHRGISNEKAVSPHSSLPCIKCHPASQEHMVNPRSASVQKPTGREFCGQCHSKDADSSRDIPRIDLKTHWERYLCWDCHYPHSPEAL